MKTVPSRALWGLLGVILAAVAVAPWEAAGAQGLDDPFDTLRRFRSQQPVRVPPRALAVIPERHTGRLLVVVDELDAFEPQFDDLARGLGLTGESAIQLRTAEARIPVFVPKTEGNISTLLQVPIGTSLAMTGLLIPRAGRYILLASDVRPISRRRSRRR